MSLNCSRGKYIYIPLYRRSLVPKRAATFRPPVRINRPLMNSARLRFPRAARTFSLNRLTLVRYLSECSRDLRRVADISVIDISIPGFPMRSKIAQADPVYVYTHTHMSGCHQYACLRATRRARVHASAHVCAFASCGFVVCPEGRTTSCLRSLVLFASLRPARLPSPPPLHARRDLTTLPPGAPRIDRQHACLSIDALCARKGSK